MTVDALVITPNGIQPFIGQYRRQRPISDQQETLNQKWGECYVIDQP